MGDSEKCFAGAGGAGAEHKRMTLQRSDVGILRRRARAHRPFAQVDLFKARSRCRGIVLEQRPLRDRKPDRALDIAGNDIIAARRLFVGPERARACSQNRVGLRS